MKNKLNYTFGLLLLLTLATFLVINLHLDAFVKKSFIIALFSVKFLVVAFQFMELEKAHSFWKISTVTLLIIINLIVIIS
ncbi:cytochrome C oxidase subunit IV family protein [Flavobacterium sp.]|uniref:cytochrome C oxidase subunit IV family protein n=1 Tax=Flavobacterium sp. TaxID=239 RepID=UPI0026352EC3|nr:cytochrome C oxidase subunit IV family protein [Flavobacterium sp.]MDD3004108.1 cytochrome C oxidase subunit IV family protein [Flavobacterium sp.]